MSEYVTGQIYGWNGGECPVHPETVVQVWLRMGTTSDRQCANGFPWSHLSSSGDIVCFQVITPYAEPKVFWVNEYADGSLCAYSTEEEAKKAGNSFYTRVAVEYVEKRND